MPSDCFTPLSTRLLSSGGSDSLAHVSGTGASGAAGWCPSQDLVGVATADGWLHVHRLNWGRILSVEIEAHDGDAETCAVTTLAWRADGKALALGCRCGRASLLSIEARRVVAEWTPAEEASASDEQGAGAGADDAPAALTCVRWVDAMPSAAGARAPGAALLQALYLRAQGAAPRGLRRALQEQEAAAARDCTPSGSSGSSGSPDGAPLYFGESLPALDSVLETFNAAALPAGVVAPNAAAAAAPHQHRSARAGATGPPAGSAGSTPLRDVLHDAAEFGPASMPLLLLGDARGRYWLRAFGTLDVLQGRLPGDTPVLAMDWCGISGTLSLAGRVLVRPESAGAAASASASTAATAALSLHSVVCTPLQTRPSQLLQLAHQLQQVSLLQSYIRDALAAAAKAWTPVRRGFANRMAGLADVIDEFANDAAERRKQAREASNPRGDGGGGDDESAADSEDESSDGDAAFERTDPQSELMHLLLTGVPSYTTQQFMSRYLSAGPVQKTMDALAAALAEVEALACVALFRAAERLVFRVESLRAASCTPEFVALGLEVAALDAALERAGAFWSAVRAFASGVELRRARYAAFASWIVPAVRLVNNEHEGASPAPAEDATDAEKDAQHIPLYGPYDTAAVAAFVEHDLAHDWLADALGDLKRAEKDEAAAAAKQKLAAPVASGVSAAVHPLLPGLLPPCVPIAVAQPGCSSSSSLCHAFARFGRAFEEGIVVRPARALAKQCVHVGALDSSAAVVSASASASAAAADVDAPAAAAAAPRASSLPLNLSTAAPLAHACVAPDHPAPSLLQQCRNLAGTGRTVALGHAASRASNKHVAAWLWTRGAAGAGADADAEGEQFVSVLQYRSASAAAASDPALAAGDSAPALSPPRVLSVHVPPAPDAASAAAADADASAAHCWAAQVVSVQLHTNHELLLMVQYQHDAAAAATLGGDAHAQAAADQPAPAVSTKLWLIDLDEVDESAWVDVDADAGGIGIGSDSLAGWVVGQLEAGAAPLLSLCAALPCRSFPEAAAAATEVISRARLFPNVLVGSVALSGARGLAALMLSGRGPPPPPPRAKRVRAPAGSSEEQAALLLQSNYKPTRRVMLLDLAEDPEEEDADADADADAEAEGEAAEEEEEEEEEKEAENADVDPDGGDDGDDDGAQPMDEDEPMDAGSPSKGATTTSSSGGRRSGSATGSPMLLSVLHASMLLLALLALVTCPVSVRGSEGDRDAAFRYCRDLCGSRCRVLQGAVDTDRGLSAGSDPFEVLPAEVLRQWDQTAPAAAAAGPGLGSVGAADGALSMEEAAVPRPAGWLARNFFGWDCASNCGYECMHANEARRQRSWALQQEKLQQAQQAQQQGPAQGQGQGQQAASSSVSPPPTWKYYGKWPFTRVCGFQELFSSLFSVANALPHLYWFVRLRREFAAPGSFLGPPAAPGTRARGGPSASAAASSSSLPMLPLWGLYSAVYTNTWLWSTVFHARDLLWTERLDYFCASIGLAFSLAVVLIRIFDIRSWRRRCGLVFLPLSLGLGAHISYLQWVHFDYGWNMRVSLCVGVVHSFLWLWLCVSRWSDAYHGRMVAVTLALWACAALEVFDFPPWARLLDAHAIWHGLTPVLGFMFYQWVRDDLRFQLKQQQENTHKHV